LEPGVRRRTPGLRREEVAQLVGVSVTWYTWFEQGRDIQVSTGFLNRVSEALRLDSGEHQTLFELAQHGPPPVPVDAALPALRAPSANAMRKLAGAAGAARPATAPSVEPESQAYPRVMEVSASDDRRQLPMALGTGRAVVAVPSRPDSEAHRINEAIRRVIASEQARVPSPPPALPGLVARPWRTLRWSIGMMILSVLMLLPIAAAS
jgi:transcriptional regulator with XRE-family HTH domain